MGTNKHAGRFTRLCALNLITMAAMCGIDPREITSEQMEEPSEKGASPNLEDLRYISPGKFKVVYDPNKTD